MVEPHVTEIGVGIAKAPSDPPKFVSVQLFARPDSLKYSFRIQNRTDTSVRYSAAGETHTVERLVDLAFARAGLDRETHLRIDPSLIRPAEVDLLVGDPAKAHDVLGWSPSVDFEGLVNMMVDADLELLDPSR